MIIFVCFYVLVGSLTVVRVFGAMISGVGFIRYKAVLGNLITGGTGQNPVWWFTI